MLRLDRALACQTATRHSADRWSGERRLRSLESLRDLECFS